ncbi:DUF3795 domain-containing protein [[Eubacterium] cellulosolvens]
MKDSKDITHENLIKYIGCCGVYCKTCKPLSDGFCKGCRLGYDDGKRDINKARCIIKLCCMKEKDFETCAECEEFSSCDKIQTKFGKEKYNFKKSMQCLEFIKRNGYLKFIKIADKWKGPFGKLE